MLVYLTLIAALLALVALAFGGVAAMRAVDAYFTRRSAYDGDEDRPWSL